MIGHDLLVEESTKDVTGALPKIADERETTARIERNVRLVCVAGESDLGRTFRLGGGPTVIGRGKSQVQLHATDISRNHARIIPEDPDYLIEDLQSSNGTFINGVPVTGKTRLKVGDRVQLGKTILVFTLHDELEERMRQLQRVEAMTTFAGGLAHDFNNMLSVILGGIHLLHERGKADPELAEIADDLSVATKDASGLVKKMMRLGRPDPITFERVKLGVVLDRAVAQLRRVCPANVTVISEVALDLGVHGSPGELHQVLMNLMLNARDAMPNGGSLTIKATCIELYGVSATAHHVGEGRYVALTMKDTGIGMDERILARAFEPFFTTKAPGKGTGLGLAMIHQIVRNHGGSIAVSSTPGLGTEFTMLLPRA